MSDEEEARRRAKAKSLRPLLNLFPLLWWHKKYLTAAFLALLAAATASLAIPLAVRFVIDDYFVKSNVNFSLTILYAAGALALFLAVSSALRFYFVMLLGERISTDLRKNVFGHILSLESSFFERVKTGEIISRLSADMVVVRTILASSASIALRNSLLLVGASAMLFLSSPALSVFVLITIPLICLPLLGFGRLVRRLSRYAQDRLADTGAMANELLGAIQTVQSFTYEPIARERFDGIAELAFISARRRIAARAFLVAVIIAVVFVAILLVIYQGSLAVFNQTMSAGELGQFIIYALMAAGSLAALGEVWGDLQLAAGAAERLFELLSEKARITSPAEPTPLPEPVKGEIVFDRVHFSYPLRPGVVVLKNFSATFSAGATTALVGMSGAGKSTLFHLLNRFDDPQSGEIRLDGIPLQKLELTALRSQLASVLQEPTLFSMSIADNILYARVDADRDEIETAAKLAAADDFIHALPEGYDTILGERGVSLSGGQRQRIAIARALIRNAPILLLDEATSALDSYNENIVQQALNALENKKTALIIAHRLTTVERADKIILINKGEVIDEGTHTELLEKNSLYQRLARQEFQT